MRGLLGWILDSNSQRLCPSIEWSCAPNANQERTGLAAQAQLSLRARRTGDDLVLHPVGIYPGFDSVPGGFPFAFAGAQLDVERVVVHGDGADRRPIPPGCIFQRPSRRVAIVLKITVISDDVAVDLLNATGDYGISQLRNDFLWWAVALDFFTQGEFAVGEIGIAAAHQYQVAKQAARTVQGASRLNRGAEAVARAQRSQGQCRSEQLRVRRGNKIAPGVEGIERFAGYGIGHQNSPVAFIGASLREGGLYARPESRHIRARFWLRRRHRRKSRHGHLLKRGSSDAGPSTSTRRNEGRGAFLCRCQRGRQNQPQDSRHPAHESQR